MARSYSSDRKFTFLKVYFVLYVCLWGVMCVYVGARTHTHILAHVSVDTRRAIKSLGSRVTKVCKPLDVGGLMASKLWSSGRATVNAVNYRAIFPAPKFTF